MSGKQTLPTFGQAQEFYYDVKIMESFLEPILVDGREARTEAEAVDAAHRVAVFATKFVDDFGFRTALLRF